MRHGSSRSPELPQAKVSGRPEERPLFLMMLGPVVLTTPL